MATDINSSQVMIDRNKHLLKRVLDIVCQIAIHNPYPSKGTTGLQCHVSEACIEALELCKNYEFDDSYEEAINLVKTSDFLRDFVKAIALMVRTRIKEEIQNCNYVSLIVSEHSKIESQSKMSLILRYLKDCKVCERYVGIPLRQFNLRKCVESATTMSCISDIISEYDIQDKLIGLSCDGAVLPRTLLKNLVDHYCVSNESNSLCTFFVPCYFHPFDVVIEQTLCYEKKCDVVFKIVNSMRAYLRKNRKFRNAFCSFMKDTTKLSSLFECTNLRFAHALKSNRREFVDFFKSIADNHEDWTVEDLTKALGYYSTLEEFNTIFLLEVFSVLQHHVSPLSEFLKGYSPEKAFDRKQVELFIASLKGIGIKQNSFYNLWSISCAELKRAPAGSKTVEEYSNTRIQAGVYETYKKLFENIVYNINKQVHMRFSFTKKIEFMQLLNSEAREKLDVSEIHTEMLLDTCGENFNIKLIKELNAIDSSLGLLPVDKLFEIVSADDMKKKFKNVRRLAEMVLTLPCSKASTSTLENDFLPVQNDRAPEFGESSKESDDLTFKDVAFEECPSCTFDVVQFWSTHDSGDDEFANEWSIFCIEQEIFQILCAQEGFYEVFLSNFRNLNALANELLSTTN